MGFFSRMMAGAGQGAAEVGKHMYQHAGASELEQMRQEANDAREQRLLEWRSGQAALDRDAKAAERADERDFRRAENDENRRSRELQTKWMAQARIDAIRETSRAKQDAIDEKKNASQDKVSGIIAELNSYYDALDESGGIVNPDRGTIQNLQSKAVTSDFGQWIGRAIGTEDQSLRERIKQARPILMTSIMAATGMSSRQIDSNAELKLWLNTATDPSIDVKSNRAALARLENFIGAGSSSPKPSDDPNSGSPPAGVDKKLWSVMTPQEKSLWKK